MGVPLAGGALLFCWCAACDHASCKCGEKGYVCSHTMKAIRKYCHFCPENRSEFTNHLEPRKEMRFRSFRSWDSWTVDPFRCSDRCTASLLRGWRALVQALHQHFLFPYEQLCFHQTFGFRGNPLYSHSEMPRYRLFWFLVVFLSSCKQIPG